jgi:flagellar biosynthesis/type III secretory pathway protein FliH
LVGKIAGDALAQAPEKAIIAMIEDCLGVLQNQPKINLLVHPTCFKPIEDKLREIVIQHHLENTITLKESADLNVGDARIDWGTGNADRDMDALWGQVKDMINNIDFSTLATPQNEQESIQGEDNE